MIIKVKSPVYQDPTMVLLNKHAQQTAPGSQVAHQVLNLCNRNTIWMGNNMLNKGPPGQDVFGFAPQPDLKDSVTKVVNSARV